MSDFIPSFSSRKPLSDTKKDWLDMDEPQICLFQGMRKSGKGVGVDGTAEKLVRAGITTLHIWGARSYENLYWIICKNCGLHYKKLKIIVKSILENHYEKNKTISEFNGKKLSVPIKVKIGLKERCLQKGLTEKEYDEYLDLAIKRDLLIRVDEKHVKLSRVGVEFARDELLHCKCDRAYPIILVVPYYVKFIQSTVDAFNQKHSPYWVDPIGIKRITKPLLKIRHIVPPVKPDKKEKFVSEMTDIILQARRESRIVVMNPSFFEIADEKFSTLAEIINMLPYLMNTSGHFTPLKESDVGKDMKKWTKKQKSWHKLAIIINEIRSAVPSGKLYGETKAGKSRRSVVDKIPEMRHMKTWFITDFQLPTEIDQSVVNLANSVIVKRSSKDMFGDKWKWIFSKVADDRLGLIRKQFRNLTIENSKQAERLLRKKGSRFRKAKKFVDDRRPMIEDMPDDVGYVTAQGMSIKRQTFPLPSFHHKTSLEDFKGDTGLEWIVDLDDKTKEKMAEQEISKGDRKIATKEKKDMKNFICKKIHHMRTVDGKSFAEVKIELVALQRGGDIPDMGYEKRDPVYFNVMYLRWKDANNIE